MRGKLYADVTGAKKLFQAFKSDREKRAFLRRVERDALLSNPGPAFHAAYGRKVNRDIAQRPWAYDWSYWPLEEADLMRAERRETLQKIKTQETITRLEARLAQLKGSL